MNKYKDEPMSEYEFEDGLSKETREYYNNSKCLFRAGSTIKVNWDLAIMVLAIWNCFVIPFQVAFEPPFADTTLFSVSDFIVDFMFFLDIIVHFRTTFIHPKTGEEIFYPMEIAKHYLKGRFWIDLLATIPFDTIAEIIFSGSNVTMLQLFSLLKLARVLRLGRIIAYLNVKNEIKMSLKLFKLVFFLLLYLH